MPFILFKFVALAFLLASIFSCTSKPTHLIVSPQVYLAPSNLLTNKAVNIAVVDMRTSTHIIQILEKDEAAVILSAELRLEDTIEELLVSHWKRQGLVITSPTENNMTVTIEKAIISVAQESVSYTTQSEIIIKVTIDNDEQTLTSSFKKRAYSEGALQADIAVLEREFNQHLSALLKQILISKDIRNFL